MIASEEEDHPVLVEEAFNSKYVAVFDPLDGSSNIDAAISTGTIFGIFEETEVSPRSSLFGVQFDDWHTSRIP